jgi:hypothetical protein
VGAKTPYALQDVFYVFYVNAVKTQKRRPNMEIKVRNVCPVAVSKLDRLAKEKGLSRQAFLKEQIETLSIMKEVEKQEQAIDDLYDRTIEVMEKCSDAMTNMDRTFNKLLGEDEE